MARWRCREFPRAPALPSFLVEGCGPLQGGGVTSGGGRGTGGGGAPGGPFSGPPLPAVTGVEVEKNGAGAADPAAGVSCSPGSGSSKVTGSAGHEGKLVPGSLAVHLPTEPSSPTYIGARTAN